LTVRLQWTAAQAGFLGCQDREAQFRGGLGSGKTRVGGYWALRRASKARRVIVTEPTYPMVRDVLVPTLEELLEVLKVRHKWNRSAWTLQVGGGLILLRSGDNPDSLRGINAHDGLIDEASYTKEKVLDQMIARTRKSSDAQIRVLGTPHGRDWVYHWQKEGGARLYTQSTFANPFIPPEYKVHLARRYSREVARQELLGEIVNFSTGVLRSDWLRTVAFRSIQPAARVRAWDLAVTEKTHSDYTAGILLSTDWSRNCIERIDRFKLEWPKARARIIQTAREDGPTVPIVVEAVGAQRALVQDLQASPELAGFAVLGTIPRGSKFNRALTWAASAEAGKFEVVAGPNAEDLREEMDAFAPDQSHRHDDLIDALSQAYIYLLDNPASGMGRVSGLYC